MDPHLKRGSMFEKLVVMLSSQKHDTQDKDTPFPAPAFFPISLLLVPHPGIYTSLYSCHCLDIVYRYSSYHLPIIIIPFSPRSLSSASITHPSYLLWSSVTEISKNTYEVVLSTASLKCMKEPYLVGLSLFIL